MIVPSEQFECERLASWLDANGYLFSHLPLSTYTPSHAIRAKNTRMGVRSGVPDYVVLLKNGKTLWLEMKRTKGGRTSKEQLKWIEALNQKSCCSAAAVVAGFEQALEEIQKHENRDG